MEREIALPLPDGSWLTLSGKFPMAEAAWNQLIVMLNAMKPGLTVGAQGPYASQDTPGSIKETEGRG
jgi:hypothetical protein